VKNILYNRAIQIIATRRGVSTRAFPRSEIVFRIRATCRLCPHDSGIEINRSIYYIYYIYMYILHVYIVLLSVFARA